MIVPEVSSGNNSNNRWDKLFALFHSIILGLHLPKAGSLATPSLDIVLADQVC